MKKLKKWQIALIAIAGFVIFEIIYLVPFSAIFIRCSSPEEALRVAHPDCTKIDSIVMSGDAALAVYSTWSTHTTVVIEKDEQGWIPPDRKIVIAGHQKEVRLKRNSWLVTHNKFHYDNIVISKIVTDEDNIHVSDNCQSDFKSYKTNLGGLCLEWYFTSMKELPKDYELYIGDEVITFE